MTDVQAINSSGFPGSFRTARRRVRASELLTTMWWQEN
jgi:hypothetical protein